MCSSFFSFHFRLGNVSLPNCMTQVTLYRVIPRSKASSNFLVFSISHGSAVYVSFDFDKNKFFKNLTLWLSWCILHRSHSQEYTFLELKAPLVMFTLFRSYRRLGWIRGLEETGSIRLIMLWNRSNWTNKELNDKQCSTERSQSIIKIICAVCYLWLVQFGLVKKCIAPFISTGTGVVGTRSTTSNYFVHHLRTQLRGTALSYNFETKTSRKN